MPLILIGGGSRSGKSRFALDRARARGRKLIFIATAQAWPKLGGDDEMRHRIDAHRSERGPDITTVEEPLDVAGALQRFPQEDAIVVDCLTLWLTNLMLGGGHDLRSETERLLQAATQSRAPVFAVTNEVGCGIVPENELARRFRDEAGRLNQAAAEAAEEVYWMVFGCPLRVK